MSDRIPNLSLVQPGPQGFLGAGAGLAPNAGVFEAKLGDEQVDLLSAQYDAAVELIEKHREQLDALAARLLENEKLEAADVVEILGERPDGAPVESDA